MYKWHQSNNLVYISFNIPSNIGKQDIHADITSSAISLGVKGYGLNCEGTLYSSIKGSKWAIKDGMVQVQMDKQQTGTKWSQLLSEVTESNPKAMVLFEYEPTSDEELALSQNEVINILSKDDSGWWEGSKLSLNGVFPSNFVQEYPLDYQPPEDIDATVEITKTESEQTTMNQVSRVGINMMGSMDELKNKLANRKTATYTQADIEDAVNSNNNNNYNGNEESNNNTGGFVAVQPTSRGGLQRAQGKVLLNNRASTVISATPPAIQPIQPMVQLKATPKQQPTEPTTTSTTTTTTNIPINSSGSSIPLATTSKESQSTKESSSGKESSEPSNRITSLFKKPIKKITSISAFTGSHSHEEKTDKNNSGTKIKARVVYDFETKEANELNLKKGDIVVILQKDTSGWWQGVNQSTQATGWFSNTFVEEIKEVTPPPQQQATPESSKSKVKSPPPKIQPQSSSSSSQPQTVEAKLQSLSETPKLETARKAGAAKGRKPPSRVRASYLLSEDEKADRDRLKQSFYSHVVSSQKDLGMDDEQEEEEEQQQPTSLSRSGGFINPQQPSIEKPSKPAPPKRLPNMNLGSGAVPASEGPSPPLISNKPPPPPKANKPTGLSTSDGYEPSSPPTNSEEVVQKSPILSRKFPPTSPLSSSNEDAPPPPPTGKPPPLKPRANVPLPSDSPPSHEVNFKASLKSTPKPAISTSQETPSDSTPQQPTPPLKKVIKPASQQPPPPSSNQSSELTEKLNKFSELAENSAADTTTTTPTKTSPPSTTTNNTSTTPITKPPVRPPLKKPVAMQPNTTTSEEQQPTSPPTLAVNKPKLTPRSGPNSAPPSPNSAPQTSSPNSLPPSTTHKRNLSNPNTTSTPLQHKKTNSNTSTPLPTFDEVVIEISHICNAIQEQNDSSQDSSSTPFKHSYPLLVDSFFSVAVCSTDGQFWGNDDNLNDHCVPMFQAIYPFLYAILCEEIGVDEVSKYIDSQPKPLDNSDQHSKPTNDQKKAHNPFTLSGQLVIAHLFSGKYSNAVIARIYQFLNTIQQLVNSSSVSCDMVSYLSQKSDTGDEVLVGHLLKSSGLIKQPDDILDFFYQLNSIQLNSKQISVLAATLASEGVCPFSPQLKLAPKSIITKTNDLLKQCNSTSISTVNTFTFNNKLIPIISDSGILMIIVPGLMGISVVSPTICNNNNNNNNNFTHYPNNNHMEFSNKLNSIFNK